VIVWENGEVADVKTFRLESRCRFLAPVTNAIFLDEVCVFVSLPRDFSLKQVFRNPSDLHFES
jgi:hypothetical protein